MKTLLSALFSAFVLLVAFVPAYAEEYCPEDGSACYEVKPLADVPSDGAGKKTEGSGSFVYVTERIPGANCVLKEGSSSGVTKRLYKCPVGEGF